MDHTVRKSSYNILQNGNIEKSKLIRWIDWIKIKQPEPMFVWVFPPKSSLTVILKFQGFNPSHNTDKLWKSSWDRTSTFSRTFQDFFCWPSLYYQETQHKCITYRAPVISIYTSTSGVSANAAIPAQPLKEKLALRHRLSSLFLFSFISLHWLKNVHISKIKFELWSSLGLENSILSTFVLYTFMHTHTYIHVHSHIHRNVQCQRLNIGLF